VIRIMAFSFSSDSIQSLAEDRTDRRPTLLRRKHRMRRSRRGLPRGLVA
jgi:hypothetical protein